MSFNEPPPMPVEFSAEEKTEMMKTLTEINKAFLQNHPEIITGAVNDLTTMIRQEKQVYVNLAIAFTIQSLAAAEKRKKV